MNNCEQSSDFVQHEAGKSRERQSGHCLRQALVITNQVAKASRSGKAALDYPASWQKHKSSLGLS